MIENLKRVYAQETLAERNQRMIPAAAFGALIATAYVWALSLVNVYTFANLTLGIDWLRVIGMWLGLTLALTLFGAISAWFTEEYAGVVAGALIFTGLIAIWFLLSASVHNSTVTMQSIISVLPLVGVNMLAALGLRWAARRYVAIQQEQDASSRRKHLIQHIAIILFVGLFPGLIGRMDSPQEQTIRQLHELLQAAPRDQSLWSRLPLKQVPTLKDHFGVKYRIYAHQSATSVGSLAVTVRFTDGFVMTCDLPVSTQIKFITQCNEGDQVQASP
jgi:hypothetical protein